LAAKKISQEEELTELVNLMSGEFSSKEQSENDSLFYDISLTMFPIWESDKMVKWLYVEQAVTEYIDKPYRQRIYKITKTEDGFFESRVYELPNPDMYIHGWEHPDKFNEFSPDALILRDGCAVYLKKNSDGCYTGSTNEQDCKSSLRGASYATSVVTICEDKIVSWDQGWNVEGTQVWGAVTEGYIFRRIPK
jgi:hypothetical protein